jgi:hypothetical protein
MRMQGVDCGDAPTGDDRRGHPDRYRASSNAEIEHLLTGRQPRMSYDTIDDLGEATIDFTEIDRRYSIPNTDLPF